MTRCVTARQSGVIVFRRAGNDIHMKAEMFGGIGNWNMWMRVPRLRPLDSEHPLTFYTSGSPESPKGSCTRPVVIWWAFIDHHYVFDIRDEDIFWCTADVGWVTGHSYRLWSAACERRHGCHDTRRAELARADRFWKIIEEYRITSSIPRRRRSAHSFAGATNGSQNMIFRRFACSAP
jgi:acetyl-CoA synthetase